jgi:hypothetical protein
MVRLLTVVDVLESDLGQECLICFEDFLHGNHVARLDCLCVYHEHCIEEWFLSQVEKVGQGSCPVHCA